MVVDNLASNNVTYQLARAHKSVLCLCCLNVGDNVQHVSYEIYNNQNKEVIRAQSAGFGDKVTFQILPGLLYFVKFNYYLDHVPTESHVFINTIKKNRKTRRRRRNVLACKLTQTSPSFEGRSTEMCSPKTDISLPYDDESFCDDADDLEREHTDAMNMSSLLQPSKSYRRKITSLLNNSGFTSPTQSPISPRL